MGLYVYFLVFIVALLYLFVTWEKDTATSPKLLAAIMAYMAIFIGIGDMIGGYDRYIYGEMFDVIADEIRRDGNLPRVYYFVNGQEWGYFAWEVLVSIVTRNRYIYILITCLLMYSLYFIAFKRFLEQYPMAVIVFLGFFFFFSITYLRQAIAVGIAWNAVNFIWERKLFKFLVLVLLAVLFHNSALILLPAYFVGSRYYSYYLGFAFLIVCLFIGLSPLPPMLLSMSGEVLDMASRTSRYATEEIYGVRYDYILQVVVLLFIIYLNRSSLKRDAITNTFLNMSFLYFGVLLVFIRFGQGGRFGWFFIIAIIYLFTNITTGRNVLKGARELVVVLCFILFYRIAINWSFNLTPYETFLTPGYPSGDRYIYEKWEYDQSYVEDKFYR